MKTFRIMLNIQFETHEITKVMKRIIFQTVNNRNELCVHQNVKFRGKENKIVSSLSFFFT